MRSIDIHAHLTPQCFWRATETGEADYENWWDEGRNSRDHRATPG